MNTTEPVTHPTSIGRLKGKQKLKQVWHPRSDGKKYWIGQLHDRTANELMLEVFTVLDDLRWLHPELNKRMDAMLKSRQP